MGATAGTSAGPLSLCDTLERAQSNSRRKVRSKDRTRSGRLAADCVQTASECVRLLLDEDPVFGLQEGRDFSHPIAGAYKIKDFFVGHHAVDADAEDLAKTQALQQAARTGDFKKLVDTTEEGADLTAMTMRGQDVLMLAAACRSSGTIECIRFLLDARMNIESRDTLGWTPLAHACRNGAKEAAIFLMEMRAAVDAPDLGGRTPLMLACMEGAENICEDIVKAGAEIRAQDKRGWSPLFYAAENGKQDLVKTILRKYATPHQTSKDGFTALMVATVRGQLGAMKQLIRRGGNIDHRDLNGNTSLMLGLAAQQLETSRWLVEEGIEVESQNNAGENAFDIAEARGGG
eukprot:TRINITY_DN7454_c3_g2_i2.p1 TRINITY_DN7454_c3_g2~~TRINITY_DN7454_c3_g2_i2.p1  ORF type:complete len:347 (-),score=78.56 TRINITY_DN7454_c3_g2_i2:307-1347(-)